jgi:hypothetical protein
VQLRLKIDHALARHISARPGAHCRDWAGSATPSATGPDWRQHPSLFQPTRPVAPGTTPRGHDGAAWLPWRSRARRAFRASATIRCGRRSRSARPAWPEPEDEPRHQEGDDDEDREDRERRADQQSDEHHERDLDGAERSAGDEARVRDDLVELLGASPAPVIESIAAIADAPQIALPVAMSSESLEGAASRRPSQVVSASVGERARARPDVV